MKLIPICILSARRFAMAVLFAATIIDVAFSQPGFWQSLNGPEGGVVQCFAVDNQANILAGTYFGGVYKTTNRGGSWVRVSYGNWDIRALVVHPSTGHIFLGAATSGVWRSTDGGATWVRPTNTVNGRTVTSLALSTSGNLIATCASNVSQSVFQSTDNGETFFHVSSGLFSGNCVIRGEGNAMYAAGERNGVLRSTDGGFLWSLTNPSPAQFNGLSMTANANYVYVVGRRTATTVPDSSFIYRRSIATGNWELVHIRSGVILRTISSTGDSLLAAGDTTVLVSFNAGQTWVDRSPQNQNAGPLAGWARFLSSHCERDIQLVGSAGRSVAFSNDFALTWTQSSQGLQNTHIVAGTLLPNGSMVVASQFDGLFRIDGMTITRTGAGLPPNDVVTVLASDNANVYLGTFNNGLWKSTNGGGTCQQALYGPNATGILTISTTIPGIIRAAGRGEFVHTSTDGAFTWTDVQLPSVNTNIRGIAEISASRFFVATGEVEGSPGGGNGVYESTNNGASFTQRGLQFTAGVSFDRLDNGLLFTSTGNQIYEGGVNVPTTWTPTPTFNLGINVRDAVFYRFQNQPVLEVVGSSGGFHHRQAFTSNPWIKLAFPELEISKIFIRNAGGLNPTSFEGQVILGTYGGGVFQSTSPLTSVGENKIIPGQFALEQNYPNPFNPATTIRFSIPVGTYGHTSLRVYDVLGREVAILVNEVKQPGEYEVQWDASNFSSGVYFYRMRAGSFQDTKKLILAK
ncbi:MAG: hypothetical protein HW412_761 [Bacteroidetes bacterium]|nr:hypothetical protein [Bacteroidota bacterium]